MSTQDGLRQNELPAGGAKTSVVLEHRHGSLHIELMDVVKRFTRNEHVAEVGPITMDVRKGELVSIVGHSGCGKTTILNLIGGLIQPTKGVVKIDGREIKTPQKNCGFVFQEVSLFPWRTALENVEFGLEIRNFDRPRRRLRARECLELVGLGHISNSYPKELSGGMKQRVAIARALAYEPSILLMDEPFGSLDAQTRDEMHEDLMKIWSQTQKTVVFVTHSIREAVYLASRLFLMKAPENTITRVFEVPNGYPRGLETQVSSGINKVIYDIHKELRVRSTLGRSSQ